MMKFFIFCFVFVLLFNQPAVIYAQEDESGIQYLIQSGIQSRIKFEASPDIQIGEYNGRGTIEALNNKSIIINDTVFYVSPFLKKFDLKGRHIYEDLKKGQYIYYFLDQENRVEKLYIGTDVNNDIRE